MVKIFEESRTMRGTKENEPFFEEKKLGNFVLDGNGQIHINRKGIDTNYGFRLQELNHNTEICSNKDLCDETTTSVSGYSNYKQRIDAMFDDRRSLISEKSKDIMGETRCFAPLLDGRTNFVKHHEKKKDTTITNNIQEKIEKMFEDISTQSFQRSNSVKNMKTNTKDEKIVPKSVQNTLSHSFKVIYLGAKPLSDKIVSLINLQDPLKELYFEYKKNGNENQVNTLSISREGLKIKTAEKEHLNPFPTIAVWASVKLVFRSNSNIIEYAFLPLIKDPDGIDKDILFRELQNKDKSMMMDHLQNEIDENKNSPIFTVVMKNNAMNKQLQCHGFICTTSEEAIIIAANLYQALMKKVKRKKEAKEQKMKEERNGELKETIEEEKKEEIEEGGPKVKKVPPPVPKRPPRKEKKNSDVESLAADLENTLEISPKSDKPQENKELINELEQSFDVMRKHEKADGKVHRRGSVPTNVYSVEREPLRTLRRTASERGSNGIISAEPSEGGDILTKVAIPRSRSFLNANGPLTRYSRRYKTNTQNAIESPLGFTELFNEFRLNEGLESMDDILNAIIDAEGMSFNDLKPIYKEFLLKLAAALTKDELYQRSKIIMRRQKKKSRNCNGRKRAFISTTRLSKVFKKTASKLGKGKGARPTNLEFTSIVFQSGSKMFETSTSNTSMFKVKQKFGPKRRLSSRRRVNKKTERKKTKTLTATSEESDFFSRRNTVESGGCPNRSSSGYFSCSECSYDSENCTCTSADKCYCSLGQEKIKNSVMSKCTGKNKSSPNQVEDVTSLKSCGCDTLSCANSDKCYCNNDNNVKNNARMKRTKIFNLSDVKGICQTPHLHDKGRPNNVNCPIYTKGSLKKQSQSIFEQLKQQGFAASDSSLSRADSSSTAWRNNEEKMRKPKDCLKTSRSLEFLQIRPPESLQQISECPTPSHSGRYARSNFDNYLLKEIQNTSQHQKFVEGTRHYCYHGSDLIKACRRSSLQPNPSFHSPGFRYCGSMGSRNGSAFDFSDLGTLHHDRMHRTKNFFNSMRSKSTCDIFNHVKFPNANTRNSSLRFTRRMDVYDSFTKTGCTSSRESYLELLQKARSSLVDHSNENFQKDRFRQSLTRPHDSRRVYQSNGGSDNFQKLDYDLFSSGKSETSESPSKGSDRKVLVVSARDPTGKVLYMGASSRGERSSRGLNDLNYYLNNSTGNASEALSVKKSAEIAALFSDMAPKTRLHRTGHFRNDKYERDQKGKAYRSMNMENTLGYLP